MLKRYLTLLLAFASVSCAVHDETLVVGGDLELVTVKFENNKPRVRVATGLDSCRWGGRYDIRQPSDYEVKILCSVSF